MKLSRPQSEKIERSVTFLVDTREQLPFEFGKPIRTDFFGDSSARTVTLSEGDYAVSLDGGATVLPVRLERKSIGDLFGVFGFGRERFERELMRLEPFAYRALVIETTLDAIASGYMRSQISPRVALGSLCAWSVRHGLPVWFAENHKRAAAVSQRLLENFAVEVLRREGESHANC
jgi:ERCC4-type nuclease